MGMGCNLDEMARFVEDATHRYQLLAAAPNVKSSDEEHPFPYHALAPALEKAWLRAADVFNRGEVITSIVTGWNRGGLLVRWQELQGFVPASQLRDITVFECDEPRIEVLAGWVGEELALKIIELDKERNRLVFLNGPQSGVRMMVNCF